MTQDMANDGWSHKDKLPEDTLHVYRNNGPVERNYPNSSEDTHLFIHTDNSHRNLYTVANVSQLLTASENPAGIQERIVDLIPRLSPSQQIALFEGVGNRALDRVALLSPDVIEVLINAKKVRNKAIDLTKSVLVR